MNEYGDICSHSYMVLVIENLRFGCLVNFNCCTTFLTKMKLIIFNFLVCKIFKILSKILHLSS